MLKREANIRVRKQRRKNVNHINGRSGPGRIDCNHREVHFVRFYTLVFITHYFLPYVSSNEVVGEFKMWSEFKQFISRGNVFDLAIAVIIGSAFGKIVESIVQDLMMPTIGVLFGGINFEGLELRIGAEVIEVGKFLGALVDFLLVAMSIFLMIKVVNHLKGGEQQYKVRQTTNLEVLQEIRDILIEDNMNGLKQTIPKPGDQLTKSGMKIQMRADRKPR